MDDCTPWFKNGVNVISTADGMRPVRFTPRQLQHYTRTDNLRIRSCCSSGAALDIVTDSDFIEFDYTVGAFARSVFYFDIFVNGVFVSSLGTDCIEDKEGQFRYELSCAKEEGGARITIYLPHLAELSLRNLRLADGALAQPAPPEARNLLCLGDSITQGMDAKHPSSAYPVLLSRYLGMNLLNHGVGGDIFDKSSLDRELPFQPDFITVAYGTNDWGTHASLAEFRLQCDEYMAELVQCYPSAYIVVLTPIWRLDWDLDRPMGSFAELSRTIADVCSHFKGIRVVDGLDLVPHQPRFFGDGRVHPNDEGFMHMALGVLKHCGRITALTGKRTSGEGDSLSGIA